VRELVALAGEPDRSEQLADPQVGILLRLAAQPEGDVFLDTEVREQRVVLEDHADPPLFRWQMVACLTDDLAVQADLAGGDFLEAGDAAQQCRLSAARGAEQAGDPAARQPEADAIDDGMPAVALDDAIQFKLQHGGRL